ncbi:hypothetical protein [Apilactobacillus xinyiensis]|uniref:hypothetical protein n=1 Tax=Apilactobacillus xinyiensis TaxID=2841032 RepID=UPI00200D8982|nr:hypothetical protein [Apilactobacillus xinyiensis]MCL0330565.1 hypothetical protein [Apilactobacillus xinyiensis]
MKRGILFYYKGSNKIPDLYCFSDCSSVIKGESDELKVRKTKNDKFKTMHFLDNQKNKIYLWDEDKFYYANQN